MSNLSVRLRSGDPDAYEEFHQLFSGRLHRFISRMVGHQDAEDLVQEVFLRVLRSIRKYAETDRFEAWVYTIASNLCLDVYRRRRPTVTAPDLAASERYDPEWQAVRSEQLQALLLELRALPFEQRQVFLLREEAGLSFKEIARLLNAPLGTVLARMKYAMDRLRARFFRREVVHAV
jgi:RNA polymerase sigma-70 factor (ECF subfamily)